MASFTDRSPATFTPYIAQNNVDAMVTVGMDREQKYQIGVQNVQNSINNISQLSTSLVRPEAKKYLASKLDSLVTDINASNGQDFSDPLVYGSLMRKANEVGGDHALNVELQGSLAGAAKIKEIQDLKAKDPKLYSQYNEEYAMEDYNAWANSGAPVGTPLVDRKPFSPYTDYGKEIQEAVTSFLAKPDEFDQLDPNTGIVVKHKGKSAQQTQLYLNSVLSSNAKNQMAIEGHVIGNRMSDRSVAGLYQQVMDAQINQEKGVYDQLQKQYFQPTSKLTDSEKNILKTNIANQNIKIDKLTADKNNPEILKSALQNKGDFYAGLYASNIINGAAQGNESVTYESNTAAVQVLDRAFNQRMEQYRQANMNARDAAGNALGWARLNQEKELKLLELEGKGVLPGAEGYQVGGYGRGGVRGFGTSATTGTNSDPFTSAVGVGRTPTNTRVDKDQAGYERFTQQSEALVVNYGLAKENLLKQMITDPTLRQELAGGIGEHPDQVLSRYVAAPTEANIYQRYALADPKLRNTFNNMLEARHEQWLKNGDVGANLNKFFTETDQTRVKIEARDNFDKVNREQLKGNLASAGINDVQIGGKTITVDNMIDYAINKNNPAIEQLQSIVMSSNKDIPERFRHPEQNPLYLALNKVKNSQAFKEYTNNFNESFGTENQISYTHIPLDDKKNVFAQRYFDQKASQISQLFNDSRRGTTVAPSEINPEWTTDLRTGEVTFSYTKINEKGKPVVVGNNKIIVPSFKNQFNDANSDFNQTLFYGRGKTPLMNIRGLRPLKVAVVSSSDDPNSQYTVNADNTPATYNLMDASGNYIKSPIGGFPNPTAALKYIEEYNNQSVVKNIQDWYTAASKDSRFTNLSEDAQAKYLDQYINSIDATNNIQKLSGNSTINMLRDMQSAAQQQTQNQR